MRAPSRTTSECGRGADPGSALLIGAQDITRNVGATYYYGNGTGVANNSGLRVSSEGLPVPEPASLLLLGTGLLGAAKLRRRK